MFLESLPNLRRMELEICNFMSWDEYVIEIDSDSVKHFPKIESHIVEEKVETKEELFDLLLEEGRKLLYNSIEIKFRSCNNALDKLKAIIMIQIKSLIKYEDFVTVLINNTLGNNTRSKKSQKALDEYMGKIQEVIQEGIDEGIFYDGDTEGIAYGIFGVNFSSLLYRLKKNRNVTAEEIYKSYIEIVIRGLTKASN